MQNSYVTVDEFKDSVYFNGLEDYFTTNTQISGFIDGVCSLVDNYIGRNLLTGYYEDEFVGRSNSSYMTHHMPLISVQQIDYRIFTTNPGVLPVDDGVTASGIIASGNYIFSRLGLIKTNVRLINSRIYTVRYIAGYQFDQLPFALKTACLIWAKIIADSNDTGNLSQPDGAALNKFKFDKFEETYVAGTKTTKTEYTIPMTVAGILDKFKYSRG